MIIMDRWTAPNGRRFALAKFEMNENMPKHLSRFPAFANQEADRVLTVGNPGFPFVRPCPHSSLSARELAKFKRRYVEGKYVKVGTKNTDVFCPARVAGVQLWAIVSDPEPDINEFGRIEL